MDYEKLYKEALERAKIAYKDEDRHLKATLERIFPVLKDSEDEMIRKSIIDLVEKQMPKSENKKWMIAWLEKHKKVDQKFNIGDTVCRKFYEDHTIKRIYYDCDDPVYVCKNEEGLESHIPFSEQDEWELKETTNVKATKDTPNKGQPQPKQDWSEENEERLNQIADYLKYKGYEDDSIWLKSLKDRFQL